jgi:threonine synthase
MLQIRCTDCHSAYPDSGMPHRCPQCGGIFDYDGPFPIQKTDLEKTGTSIWQYKNSFRLSSQHAPVSMGEGKTPLLMRTLDGQTLGFKMESSNPSGSYKDRGTSLLVTELKGRNISFAVEDSSGNAGASFATYCSWAGIDCKIFVPESASGAKLAQISRSNAELIKVPGARSNATQALLDTLQNDSAVYASHAWQPFSLPGIATIAYELVEELGKAPGTVFAPLGHGGLFLGLMRGFNALYEGKLIQQMPKLIGVQGLGFHPLVAHFHPEMGIASEPTAESLAEGVRIQEPARFDQILAMSKIMDCDFVACSNAELEKAISELWKMGIYVEMTSALVWAAFRKNLKKLPEPIIFILTGSGLKY